jgi:hypothetical protein
MSVVGGFNLTDRFAFLALSFIFSSPFLKGKISNILFTFIVTKYGLSASPKYAFALKLTGKQNKDIMSK